MNPVAIGFVLGAGYVFVGLLVIEGMHLALHLVDREKFAWNFVALMWPLVVFLFVLATLLTFIGNGASGVRDEWRSSRRDNGLIEARRTGTTKEEPSDG